MAEDGPAEELLEAALLDRLLAAGGDPDPDPDPDLDLDLDLDLGGFGPAGEVREASVRLVLSRWEELSPSLLRLFSEGTVEACGAALRGMLPPPPVGGDMGMVQIEDEGHCEREDEEKDDGKDEDDRHGLRGEGGIAAFVRTSLVEPLWESDDRWANRAALAAALGMASLALWRGRGRRRGGGRGVPALT